MKTQVFYLPIIDLSYGYVTGIAHRESLALLKDFGWKIHPEDHGKAPDEIIRIFRPLADETERAFICRVDSIHIIDMKGRAKREYGLDWKIPSNYDSLSAQPDVKLIHLTNWWVQAATGYLKHQKAPTMLSGIDADTDELVSVDIKYLSRINGKYFSYIGPAIASKTGPKTEIFNIILKDIRPEYEKWIRRWSVETWDPENPIRLETK
jgi:hypothetical protein